MEGWLRSGGKEADLPATASLNVTAVSTVSKATAELRAGSFSIGKRAASDRSPLVQLVRTEAEGHEARAGHEEHQEACRRERTA